MLYHTSKTYQSLLFYYFPPLSLSLPLCLSVCPFWFDCVLSSVYFTTIPNDTKWNIRQTTKWLHSFVEVQMKFFSFFSSTFPNKFTVFHSDEINVCLNQCYEKRISAISFFSLSFIWAQSCFFHFAFDINFIGTNDEYLNIIVKKANYLNFVSFSTKQINQFSNYFHK